MAEPPKTAVPDLRSRVMRGLVWVGASQVGLQLTRAIVAIFIARLLTPEEYGLAALALIFCSFVLVFSDVAMGAAIIQRPSLTPGDKDTAFWVTVGSGVLFTIVGVALSGPIARLYGEPDAQPLLAALSSTFVLGALGATQQSLMLRDMDYRRLELLPMLGAVAGGVSGVALAVAGAGAWAIILQQIVSVAVTTALVWWRGTWRPRFTFSGASVRYLGSFSLYMLSHRIVYYIQVNGDRFLIGRFLNTAALGAYAVAYNTMLVPASKIGGPVQRVMSPAFCRIQDDPERIAAQWARITRLMAVVSVPALAGLVAVAPDFVPLVLGEQWRSAIPVVQVLAWVGIVQALGALNVDILMARDRTRTILLFSIVLTAAHLTAFSIGLQWGVVGVAASYAVSSTLVEPWQAVLAARALGVSPLVFFRSVAGVFQAALGMVAVVLAVRVGLLDAGVPAALRLLLCIAAGGLSYAVLCAWRVPEVAAEARDLLRRRRGRTAPAGPLVAPAPAAAIEA
jgi:O-antigen/teichoic acid export membrane protein